MISLILAAGNGSRFATYAQPKPLLPMPDGRPLISWVCDRLPAGERVVVSRRQDAAALHPYLGAAKRIDLDYTTDGPLASAYAAREYLYGEILILYCDVVLNGAEFVRAARKTTAPHACVTFTSADPRYGYWDGERVVEKQVVSDRAVSGAFYFRDAADFVARAALLIGSASGIPTILDADTFCFHTDDVIDVGTPADYEAFVGTEAVHV